MVDFESNKKNMNFVEATEAIEKGYRVKRASWPVENYIGGDNEEDNYFDLCIDDVKANDWEIVDIFEILKEKLKPLSVTKEDGCIRITASTGKHKSALRLTDYFIRHFIDIDEWCERIKLQLHREICKEILKEERINSEVPNVDYTIDTTFYKMKIMLNEYLGEKGNPFILLHPSDYGRFRRNGNIKSEDEDVTLSWLMYKCRDYDGDEEDDIN